MIKDLSTATSDEGTQHACSEAGKDVKLAWSVQTSMQSLHMVIGFTFAGLADLDARF